MKPYEISHDPRGFVRVVLRGYWSLELLDRFNDEMDLLVAHHTGARNDGGHDGGHDGGPLKLLVDGRQQEIQPREVMDALQRRAHRRGAGSVRVAVVVATMLRKLQADRVNRTADRAIFFDEAEAQAWLLADHPA